MIIRKSDILCKEPFTCIMNIIKEFFSNVKDDQNNKCFVRGMWVPFEAPSINRIYKLKDIEFHNFNTFSNVLINP
ncbi:hypothetical protein MA16_Dca021303 [Dendrobium catenatum]|uniref:Uncharacterized protein n=1 Tax=Dendrobium catenatum TaxID=906689 RepID=A0A2I0VYW9_9ASPA|nr:hypothetical protein MA16_Dca021303 [Dendrobium catenatum]